MRKVEIKKPGIETDGLVFHVATLRDVIPDGPKGIWIENEFVVKNPVLRKREKNGILFRFYAVNPLLGIDPSAPIHILSKFTYQAKPGTRAFGQPVVLDLYAEVPPTDATISLIDQAKAEGKDPGALTELAEQLLRDGYELSCEFINILRQDYGQYWLRPPKSLQEWNWSSIFLSPTPPATQSIPERDSLRSS